MLISIIGLLLFGCATQTYLPYYNTAAWDDLYQGGDGSSAETAVIINTRDAEKAADAESHYLENVFTRQGKTYSKISESELVQDGRVFHIIKIVIDNSAIKDHYFDISIPLRATLEN